MRRLSRLILVVILAAAAAGGSSALACHDLDGDGFYDEATCGTPRDCNDASAATYPGAREVCDGYDNDCDGALDGPACDTSCEFPERSDASVLVWDNTGWLPVDYALAWTGSEYGMIWQGADGVYFRRIDSAGNTIGSDVFLLSGSRAGRNAFVWNGSEYAWVWSSGEIHFARFDATGNPIGAEVPVTSTGPANSDPSLVWTGKEYGLAWHAPAPTSTEIYFTRIDRVGNKIGPDLPLTSDPANKEAPSLVWTGSEYGVAWQDGRHAGADDTNWEIYFARIDASGNKLGSDVRVTHATAASLRPTLVWTGSEYGVSWQDRRDEGDEVYFARIDATGNKIGTDERVTHGGDSRVPTLAWTGGEFGLAWQDGRHGDTAIYFGRIGADGVDLDSDLQLTLPRQWPPCACLPSTRRPALVWTGSGYGVAWLWYDLFLQPSPLEFVRIQCEGNQPPVASCVDVTVEAPTDACVAEADVDGGSFDPDGDPITLEQSPAGPYRLGTTEVTLTVSDDRGRSDSCTARVTVLDVTPPQVSVELDPDVLWPPNHRLVDVGATVVATDLCSTPATALTSITSDEPDDAPDGDGSTTNDIQGADWGTADLEFQLRAERMSEGDGRVYTVTFTAIDGSGNEASATATVLVPHGPARWIRPRSSGIQPVWIGTTGATRPAPR